LLTFGITSGIALAVVGLAGQLLGASLAGYNLFSTTRSFGKDYEELRWQFDAERLHLEEWAKTRIDGRGCLKLDLSDPRYRFTVTTLARISAVFAELPEFHSKYGSEENRGRRASRVVHELVSKSLKSLSLGRSEGLPSTASSALDQASIELLKNPRLTLVGPDLANEVARLKDSAEGLQQMLSTRRKLQWSAIDKARLEELVKRLKNYNESLNKILPAGNDMTAKSG
jgi:hypothetical protein